MGRSLLIEEDIQSCIDDIMRAGMGKSQFGLLLGQFHDTRDYAIHLARCPDPVEEEEDSSIPDVETKKTERKRKNSEHDDGIDSKWIIEHARQVNRMLTGGISVMGIFAFCSSDFLMKNQSKLRACLQSVSRNIEHNKWVRLYFPHNQRYLLHICNTTKKVTCRTLDLHDDQGQLRPAESRYQSFVKNWLQTSTCINLNVQCHVPIAPKAHRSQNNVVLACQAEIETIWDAYGTLGSKLIEESKPLVESSKTKKGKIDNKELSITLFKQLKGKGTKEIVSYEKTNVVVKFVGTIYSRAYMNSKATFGDALKALKLDIIRSLLTRIELLCEEAQVNNIYHVEEWSLMSPTRVYAPFKNLSFCDYIFKDESEDDTIGRFNELLSVLPKKSGLFYPERSPEIGEVSMILNSGDTQVDHQSDAASELSIASTIEEPRDKKIFAAVFAGAAAICAAVFHLFWNES